MATLIKLLCLRCHGLGHLHWRNQEAMGDDPVECEQCKGQGWYMGHYIPWSGQPPASCIVCDAKQPAAGAGQ